MANPVITAEEAWKLVEELSNSSKISEHPPAIGEWTDDTRALGPLAVKGTHFYNNGEVNIRRTEHPGEGWVRGRLAYKRPLQDPEATSKRLSKALKGKPAPNKGWKGISPETRKKMSESAKKRATPERMRKVGRGESPGEWL